MLGQVLARLSVVAVPPAVALLLAALFAPGVTWLAGRGVPRGLSTAAVLLPGSSALFSVPLQAMTRAVFRTSVEEPGRDGVG